MLEVSTFLLLEISTYNAVPALDGARALGKL